jgi:hypothetical protein
VPLCGESEKRKVVGYWLDRFKGDDCIVVHGWSLGRNAKHGARNEREVVKTSDNFQERRGQEDGTYSGSFIRDGCGGTS